ncbi:MAG: DNA/RNA nuclease SfsA [Gammaproteobacteria bacterium]|nr:DNA/RNA nuclease SfsA [Gammaproteobacteria bacterium]
MQYSSPLIAATLIRRYKRFLADVELASGEVITVHSPNTGSMLGCAEPGMRVWIRDTANPKRKYRYAWELSETVDGVLININTIFSNKLVREGVESGVVEELQGYTDIKAEVRYGTQDSRIDLLLSDGDQRCYVEVKNVTARIDSAMAIFPDAVTSRGARHLQELMQMVESGHRAVMLFCISRGDIDQMRAAYEIDPLYARTLKQAVDCGVEAMAYVTSATHIEIALSHRIPVQI